MADAEVKIAAIAATPEPAAATPRPEPAADIPSFEGNIATTLIATLGGPAVFIDETTSTTEAKPDRRRHSRRGPQSGPGNGGGWLQHGARASRVRQR